MELFETRDTVERQRMDVFQRDVKREFRQPREQERRADERDGETRERLGGEAVPRDVVVGEGGEGAEQVEHRGQHVLRRAEALAQPVHRLPRGHVAQARRVDGGVRHAGVRGGAEHSVLQLGEAFAEGRRLVARGQGRRGRGVGVEDLLEEARIEVEDLDAAGDEGVPVAPFSRVPRAQRCLPEPDEIAQEAVVPVHKRNLSIAGIEGYVTQRRVERVQATQQEDGQECGDVQPDVVGERRGSHAQNVAPPAIIRQLLPYPALLHPRCISLPSSNPFPRG